MSKAPLVSIIVPLYNKEKYVRYSIGSILNQTVDNFELIVVNDGSTDDGPEIVRRISDPRIRIVNQPNNGVSAARNRGIYESRSDLIAFIDADDEWMPDFLETILRLRDKFPTCAVFATSYIFEQEKGRVAPAIVRDIPSYPWEGILNDYFKIAAKSDPPIWSSAIAVTKKAITSIEGFPVGVTSGEDLLTWARLASKFDIAYSTKPCAKFKVTLSVPIKPRIPQVPDSVGEGLLKLLEDRNSDKLKSIEVYLSMWHRMRASCFLQLGACKEARQEVVMMSRYSGCGLTWAIYGMAACTPPNISKGLLKFAIYLRNSRRKLLALPSRLPITICTQTRFPNKMAPNVQNRP
jgi:hypothetical protein